MGDITQEQFDQLLDWLDADRDAAGLKYRNIQVRIIKILASRGCGEAEALADETFDRVAAKIEWLVADYVGDPALYFYAVANKIHQEYLRKKPLPKLPPLLAEHEDNEEEFNCLEACLEKLSEKNRELVERYYQDEKRAKINSRKKLADALGITLDALRIRAHRIRKELQQCVLLCVRLNATP
jgi:DNA-directed RNA polymerase specialized sigma24 family protein